MHDLTGFQRDLLRVISAAEEEPHGLAIKEDLDDYYGIDINVGRLYPNLDTLVDKGLVQKGKIDDRANSYSLSRRAEGEIEEHVRSWVNAANNGEWEVSFDYDG